MAGQELGLEPVKVFADLSSKISATRSHFDEYSSGVSKLLKLKARAAEDNVLEAIPSHLQLACQLNVLGLIQDEVFYKAVTRAPLTTQQLTNMAVVSSSLFLRYTVCRTCC